jgi:hypothetical protein
MIQFTKMLNRYWRSNEKIGRPIVWDTVHRIAHNQAPTKKQLAVLELHRIIPLNWNGKLSHQTKSLLKKWLNQHPRSDLTLNQLAPNSDLTLTLLAPNSDLTLTQLAPNSDQRVSNSDNQLLETVDLLTVLVKQELAGLTLDRKKEREKVIERFVKLEEVLIPFLEAIYSDPSTDGSGSSLTTSSTDMEQSSTSSSGQTDGNEGDLSSGIERSIAAGDHQLRAEFIDPEPDSPTSEDVLSDRLTAIYKDHNWLLKGSLEKSLMGSDWIYLLENSYFRRYGPEGLKHEVLDEIHTATGWQIGDCFLFLPKANQNRLYLRRPDGWFTTPLHLSQKDNPTTAAKPKWTSWGINRRLKGLTT